MALTKDRVVIDGGVGLGSWQVILLNDEYNTLRHVVDSLVSVFSHSEGMAHKIAMEAHNRGRSIAQVEGENEAISHAGELQAAGIGAHVEEI